MSLEGKFPWNCVQSPDNMHKYGGNFGTGLYNPEISLLATNPSVFETEYFPFVF